MAPCLALQGRVNAFQGIEIDPDSLPADARAFAQALPQALAEWQAAGLRAAWLKVPIHKAAVIPAATEHGFRFHHSQPRYAMLTRALAPDAFIPPYATHYVGVGGVVVDDRARVLVVSETHRPDLTRPFWKLPGGLLDPGEHFVAGAQREIREETGIETAFLHLVGLWHGHSYLFGASGLYAVFRLQPLSTDIRPCAREIEDCRWMPLADYLASPDVSDFNRALVQAGLDEPALVSVEMPGYPRPESHEFFFPPSQFPAVAAGRP